MSPSEGLVACAADTLSARETARHPNLDTSVWLGADDTLLPARHVAWLSAAMVVATLLALLIG